MRGVQARRRRKRRMSQAKRGSHFKGVTAVSPIQYQKRLRLLEARRLMTDDGETAEGSAFKVGYNSASQFSREYARMFGNPPLRDATRIKTASHPIHPVQRVAYRFAPPGPKGTLAAGEGISRARLTPAGASLCFVDVAQAVQRCDGRRLTETVANANMCRSWEICR